MLFRNMHKIKFHIMFYLRRGGKLEPGYKVKASEHYAYIICMHMLRILCYPLQVPHPLTHYLTTYFKFGCYGPEIIFCMDLGYSSFHLYYTAYCVLSVCSNNIIAHNIIECINYDRSKQKVFITRRVTMCNKESSSSSSHCFV